MHTVRISDIDVGKRLDKYLQEYHKESSRSQWQKHIKNGVVLVNGKKTSPHYALRQGETISIDLSDDESTSTTQPLPSIPIITETDDYLIINKPIGVQVHEAPGAEPAPLLSAWILEHYPALNGVGDTPERPGIVHRLDREASGLMVIAKNQKMFDALKEQFKAHTVVKEYQALVHGVLIKDEGTIDFAIGRSDEGRMAARPMNQGVTPGKGALTSFEVVQRFQNHTLVRVMPKTGRTHQIRVHFFALDHPLVGDSVYRYKGTIGKNQPKPTRLMLHATKLCFDDTNGTRVCYTAQPPAEFKQFIKALH